MTRGSGFFVSEITKDQMPAGRPSDYEPEFCQRAHALAQAGATDKELAEELGCDVRTLYRWKNEHPEFRQALILGKDAADDRVEDALYHRALGYSHPAIKIMQHEGSVIVEPYTEHYPPDIGALKLWLTNRRPEKWRERTEQKLDATVQVTEIVRKVIE